MEPAGSFEATPTRRTVLARGALGVGAAWVAPTIVTAPAAAQTGSPDSLRFLLAFGEQGSGPGQFLSPMSVTTGDEDFLWVADTGNNRIQMIDLFFDQDGFVFAFGGPGTGDTQFDHPTGVAFGGLGRVVVADKWNHRAKVFDAYGGNHLLTIGFDDPATPDEWGFLEFPHGVAFDNDNRILVTEDSWNHRVQFFTSSGDWDGNYGGFGQPILRWPLGVTVDASNRVHIADSGYQRITILPGVTQYIDLGFTPADVAVDASGNLYVCDPSNHRIVVLDAAGNVVHILGEFGSGDGQFNSPEGVAVDSAQRIHIADTGNHRIQVFSPL